SSSDRRSASAAPVVSSESSFISRNWRPRARSISSESFWAFPRRRSSSIRLTRSPYFALTASPDPSSEALSSTRTSNATDGGWAKTDSMHSSRSSRPLVFTMKNEISGAPVKGATIMPPMRITVVDPPAYTPPYDHALCAALARQGHHLELVTSPFRPGPVAPPGGYPRGG